MKGWRTIIVNAGLVAAEGALVALQGVGWTEMLGPTVSVFVVAIINMGLRTVTNTAMGQAQ